MDDLDALLVPVYWGQCKVEQALSAITDDTARAKVTAACRNPGVAAARIRTAFDSLIGRTLAENTIRKHQRATCGCPR